MMKMINFSILFFSLWIIYYFCLNIVNRFLLLLLLSFYWFWFEYHCTCSNAKRESIHESAWFDWNRFHVFFSVSNTVNRNMNGAWYCRLIAFVSCKLLCLFTASGTIDSDKPIKFSVSLTFHTLSTNTIRFMVANDGKWWFENIFHSFLYARWKRKAHSIDVHFMSDSLLDECEVTFVLSKRVIKNEKNWIWECFPFVFSDIIAFSLNINEMTAFR